jgi:hydrogenase maturation protein HypF
MKIMVSGTVQGVGFRPTVYRVAKALGLRGYVLNKGSNVEIGLVNGAGNGDSVADFLYMLNEKLPPLAAIEKIEVNDEPVRGYNDFTILTSSEGRKTSVTPVDTAICEECVRELFDPANRRYLYPFINCTSCGARFSVIKNVPYDRTNTSMQEFRMCEDCLAEYKNSRDRRFHAQTTSCPRCGPTYTLYDNDRQVIEANDPIATFARLIDEGALGLAKSWGGMHLLGTFEQTDRVRALYGRPSKPFAVMFRDLKAIEKHLNLTEPEERLLTSTQRPIVLLEKKANSDSEVLAGISPGLGTVGVYLPYSGLHHVLFHYLKAHGILMTSANVPGEPMTVSNEEAFNLTADYFLFHNRAIVNRLDDSVVKCYGARNQFLRRSRGFVPTALTVPYTERILSLGAMENVSSSISKDGKLYTSQYIGSTFHYPTLEFLAAGTEQLLKLLGLAMEDIDAIGVDVHPGYVTKRYGKSLADEYSIELVAVQHHWAHAAALMLDNEVEEVMALTLDGTGYGPDKKAWGGELLFSNYYSFERVGSLEEIPLIGGEMAIRDPRRLVFAVYSLLGREREAHRLVTDHEAGVMAKLMRTAPLTSSLGRILDALACYLGICQRMTYDGEPAMKLERYLAHGEPTYTFETTVEAADRKIVRTLPLFDQLADYRISTEREKANVAYSFVQTLLQELVEIAADVCESTGVQTIGITGGISYDLPIVRMAERLVKDKGFTFLTHNRVPNGDGGVSVGQNVIVGRTFKEQT